MGIRNHSKLITCLVIFTILACQSLKAEIITFQYTGTIKNVSTFNTFENLGFISGQSISGAFAFDTSASDTDPSNQRGFFKNSLSSYTFGNLEANPEDTAYSYMEITASTQNGSERVGSYLNSIYSNISDVFSFTLTKGNLTDVINNDLYDLTNLNLSDFNLFDSNIYFHRAVFLPDSEYFQTSVHASIDSLVVSKVPEPNSFILFVLGMLVFRRINNA